VDHLRRLRREIRRDQVWEKAATPTATLMAALQADRVRVNGGAASYSFVMVTAQQSPIPNRWLSPPPLVDAPAPISIEKK
jgi:hypothetical protein